MNSISTVEPETGVHEARPENSAGFLGAALAADTDEIAARLTGTVAPEVPGSAGEAARFHLLDLLIVLARRKRILLQATLAAGVLATGVSLLLPNRYTATVKILPPQPSQSLASAMMGQLGTLGPIAALAQKDLGLKNPNDLYAGMLRSRTAEDGLIRRFDLLRVYRDRYMTDARRDLEDATSVALGKEGFVGISVEDKDRRRASEMANAYVEELRQLTQNLAVTEAGQRRMFFEQQLELAKNRLADAEQALKETEQKTGLIQIGWTSQGHPRIGSQTAGGDCRQGSGIARHAAVLDRRESRCPAGRRASRGHAHPTGAHGKAERRHERRGSSGGRGSGGEHSRGRLTVCPQAARCEVRRNHVRDSGQTI